MLSQTQDMQGQHSHARFEFLLSLFLRLSAYDSIIMEILMHSVHYRFISWCTGIKCFDTSDVMLFITEYIRPTQIQLCQHFSRMSGVLSQRSQRYPPASLERFVRQSYFFCAHISITFTHKLQQLVVLFAILAELRRRSTTHEQSQLRVRIITHAFITADFSSQYESTSQLYIWQVMFHLIDQNISDTAEKLTD